MYSSYKIAEQPFTLFRDWSLRAGSGHLPDLKRPFATNQSRRWGRSTWEFYGGQL